MTNAQVSEYLARIQKLLLGTKRQERSNSARNAGYRILFDLVSVHRDKVLDGRTVLGVMRETSGFDPNERRFRYAVDLALVSLDRSPNRTELAEALFKACENVRDRLIMERAARVLERRNAALDFVTELDLQQKSRDTLHRELARI